MASKVVKVTATGLVVAMVLSNSTAYADDLIKLNNEVTVENTYNSNTIEDKTYEHGYDTKVFSDICDYGYTYVNEDKYINLTEDASKELINELESANSIEISKDKFSVLYTDTEKEINVYDKRSNPILSINLINNKNILMEKYNNFTKLSKYYLIRNKSLYNKIDKLLN